jgi:hypothetical protein
MAFEFAMQPGEPVMLVKLQPDFDVQHDTPVLLDLMRRALDAAPDRVTIVANILRISIKFSDMVYALGIVTKGDTAILHHPCIRKLVLVTTSDTIRFGGHALQQEQYGGIAVDFYATQEEALRSVHTEPAIRLSQPGIRSVSTLRSVAMPADVGQWF